jgi:hypothetical protein
MRVHPDDKQMVFDIIRPDINNGPWIAGGAVMLWAQGKPVDISDIDVFFKDEQQYLMLANLLNSMDFTCVYRTENADTWRKYVGGKNNQIVQLIKKCYFESAEDVIGRFDLSVCQFVTDGITTITGKTAVSDLKNKTFSLVKPNPDIIKRVVKYATYGYTPNDDVIDYLKENKDKINHDFKGSHEYDAAFI